VKFLEISYGAKEVIELNSFWDENEHEAWLAVCDDCWANVPAHRRSLVERMERLDPAAIAALSPEGFYDFLHDEYFVWKYIHPNRVASTRKHLRKYMNEDGLQDLANIQRRLFSCNKAHIAEAVQATKEIRGLGVAGATGLLALLFPNDFGTIDQHLVGSLQKVESLPERALLSRVRALALKTDDAVLIINILKRKANTLNTSNGTKFWTPRRVDLVLWWLPQQQIIRRRRSSGVTR